SAGDGGEWLQPVKLRPSAPMRSFLKQSLRGGLVPPAILAASNDIALVDAVLNETIKRALSLRYRPDGACQWLTQHYRTNHPRGQTALPVTRCTRTTRGFALQQTRFRLRQKCRSGNGGRRDAFLAHRFLMKEKITC
ncbi:MAG TPA: hypothetical protein VMM15_42210, partial [Bradyrhizobium sp.]|nr:hypothetical protein [Bradyrhizobium sp.]